MDAFDADVLIYAADPGHPLGQKVAALFTAKAVAGPDPAHRVGVGSVLLVPEVLSKPLRDGNAKTVRKLSELLARLDLRPVDRATAEQAAILRARYNLRTPDATHLATAIGMGAHRFITNNKRDFGGPIKEIDITYPADLG
jgi:predicted nucleic acid-binding protein